MYADAPLLKASESSFFGPKVIRFIDAAAEKAKDGLSWSEFGELMLALVRLSIETLDAVNQMTGAEKKQMVLDAVAALFDRLADKTIPPAIWPFWVLAKPSIRSLLLAITSGAVEVLLPMVRS